MKTKAHELRGKARGELNTQLGSLRQELSDLRVSAQSGGAAARLAKIRVVRKSIARVLTIRRQKELTALKTNYKKAPLSSKPKWLRPKLTHAKRLALKPYELNAKTPKQIKKESAFPQRKYAVAF
eukprot:NODE_8397_length_519_cov_52.395745_g7338_i0.p2 GENE.NODE_8397_length_519_cov_52.395745_g7338_i0~~NODE_8397_length_519_cov_52.395745_g7338_i0.p2  ORF type:complete len:125 (+),score=56.36 NODE_8397_length_519_cov_52.395745_g7338_i0:84-458(+)